MCSHFFRDAFGGKKCAVVSTHVPAGRPRIVTCVDGRVKVRHRRWYGNVPWAPWFVRHLQQCEWLCCRLRTQRMVLLYVTHPVVFLIHRHCKESYIKISLQLNLEDLILFHLERLTTSRLSQSATHSHIFFLLIGFSSFHLCLECSSSDEL
jgi:hypothetical protein